MYVRHLGLADFRSWQQAELSLEPGATVLLGANGQGKTNLVEALGYLASLGSHRVASDTPLIRAGCERAVVRAAAVADDRELRVEVEINAGRANRGRLNGSPQSRVRDVLGIVRTVLFAPEDLAVVRGDPSERRRFLDEVVVARNPRLSAVRADYERTLKQRGALLKSAGGRRGAGSTAAERSGSIAATLDVWDGHLAEYGAELLRARLATVRDLRPHTAAAYTAVAPDTPALDARYSTALVTTLPELADPESVPDLEQLRTALTSALAEARTQELERGVNLVGPHRDDLELALGELPVRGYASHGEGWSAALALRLGSYELLRGDALPGGDPILMLDDVFAELDAQRRAQLARVAAGAEQVVITAAVAADVPDELAAAQFDVRAGEVVRAR